MASAGGTLRKAKIRFIVTANPNSTVIASSKAPDEILDALLGVFGAKGFDGASLTELSRACGRSKASLYHYFPGGKGQMIEVLVSRCVEDLDRRAFRLLTLNQDTTDQHSARKPKAQRASAAMALEAFLDGFAGYLQTHQGNCLLATLALTQPDLIGTPARNRINDWLGLLAKPFEQLGNKPKASRRLAQALLARLYGSLTIAAMGAEVSMQQACKWLKKDLLAEVS